MLVECHIVSLLVPLLVHPILSSPSIHPPSPFPPLSLSRYPPSLSLIVHLVLSQMLSEEGLIRKDDLQGFLAAVDIDPSPVDMDSLFHQVYNGTSLIRTQWNLSNEMRTPLYSGHFLESQK